MWRSQTRPSASARPLRQDVSAKLNRLPLRYFDGHKTGDIMSRVTNDLEKVSSVMQVGLMQLVSSVFTIVLAAAAMVMLSPRLFLVVLVSLALSMTATGYVSALAQRAYGGNMAAMGALTGKVEELYAGNRVVKVFNRPFQRIYNMDLTFILSFLHNRISLDKKNYPKMF